MRLWTVQPITVLEQIENDGIARVDPFRKDPDGWIHPQYNWLTWRLRDRLPDWQGHPPWFAYASRPDLRWVRHSRPLGSREVLIEFEAPPGRFADFPCWAWHTVFCRGYLARNRAEEADFERRFKAGTGIRLELADHPLPAPWQTELETSWNRLLAPDLPARSWRRGASDARREAVVEVLRRDWVRGAREFTGTDALTARLLRERARRSGQLPST